MKPPKIIPVETKPIVAFSNILVKHTLLSFDYSISVMNFNFITMILGTVILLSCYLGMTITM